MGRKRAIVTEQAIAEAWSALQDLPYIVGYAAAENIYESQIGSSCCWACGEQRRTEKAHIVPVALGGSDDPLNLFILCNKCHAEGPDTKYPDIFLDFVRGKENWLNSMAKDVYDLVSGLDADSIDIDIALDCVRSELKESAGLHGSRLAKATWFGLVRRALIEAQSKTLSRNFYQWQR